MLVSRSCAAVVATALVVAGAGCGHSLPEPKLASQPKDLYYEVPYPPPAARPERVDARPSPRAVWIDGEWEWQGSRWVWQDGGWSEPPPGAVKYAPWALHRTREGRLMCAPGTWLSDRDAPVPPREPASVEACTQAEPIR